MSKYTEQSSSPHTTAERHRRSTRRDKVMALLAGGLVLGVGGALTLAAWVDEEWVFGGTDGAGGPGIGTSSFEVQQNTTNVYTSGAGWTDEEANPGGELVFGLDALSLSPGSVIYAPVALATTVDSIGGTLALQDAVDAEGLTSDAGLWAALVLSVSAFEADTLATTPPTCDGAGFASYSTMILDGSVAGLAAGTPVGGQALEPERGNVWHYCFRIELPSAASNDLQGTSVAPAWRFIAESTTAP